MLARQLISTDSVAVRRAEDARRAGAAGDSSAAAALAVQRLFDGARSAREKAAFAARRRCLVPSFLPPPPAMFHCAANGGGVGGIGAPTSQDSGRTSAVRDSQIKTPSPTAAVAKPKGSAKRDMKRQGVLREQTEAADAASAGVDGDDEARARAGKVLKTRVTVLSLELFCHSTVGTGIGGIGGTGIGGGSDSKCALLPDPAKDPVLCVGWAVDDRVSDAVSEVIARRSGVISVLTLPLAGRYASEPSLEPALVTALISSLRCVAGV